MNDQTRRGFLTLAGAGAAVVGAAAIAPAAAGAADSAAPPVVPAGVEGPLVAFVRDARAGEVAVLLGEREVVVHDLELAARIARVAG